MSKQLTGAKNAIYIQARLTARIGKDERSGYVVDCPSLGVCTQGDTVKETKANIREATELLIESCFERGVLHEVLARRRPSIRGRWPGVLPGTIKVFKFSARVLLAVRN